ncbi:MAG: Wzz/FepE/Etk N-terminal domain-containing protein [Gemmatimonadota bacterium]|nr:Wzz/FepE/Etk N-terminal domain-containing protein [Gemmatimonadota bacterium]
MADSSLDLVGMFLLMRRRWRLLATVCVLTALVAGAVNFFMLPKWYRARTVIMPPQEKSAFSGLGMLLSNATSLPGGISRLASGITSINAGQYEFVTILSSRTLADSLIDKFDLEKVYKSRFRFLARKELRNHTVIDFPPEGHIVVTVEAKQDPQLACDLANEYVRQLNNILLDMGGNNASGKRRFIASRLGETRIHLAALEDSLLEFQEKYGIIEPEEQARGVVELITGPVKSTIERLGMLQAEHEARQVQLRTLESIYTSRHPQVNLLRTEVAELGRTIARIKSELAGNSALKSSGDIIPVSDIPTISMTYTRLYRRVKIQEEMFLLLSAQFEEARINELDDLPSASVLDRAVLPEYKYRPKRLLNILISTAAAFALCLVLLVAASKLGAGGREEMGR